MENASCSTIETGMVIYELTNPYKIKNEDSECGGCGGCNCKESYFDIFEEFTHDIAEMVFKEDFPFYRDAFICNVVSKIEAGHIETMGELQAYIDGLLQLYVNLMKVEL